LGAQLYGGAVVVAEPDAAAGSEAGAAPEAAAAAVPASASAALAARARATVIKPAGADLAVLRADRFSSLRLMATSARSATRRRGGLTTRAITRAWHRGILDELSLATAPEVRIQHRMPLPRRPA
jgi:hypothetical protein